MFIIAILNKSGIKLNITKTSYKERPLKILKKYSYYYNQTLYVITVKCCMQIRELDLKELEMAYGVLRQLRGELSYKEFEDLIYDMRYMNYTMFGIVEGEELITYAGASVQTNLYHKRHLYVFDLVSDDKYKSKGYGAMMLEFLSDYARASMCQNIVLSSSFARVDAHRFYEKNGFEKKSYIFLKTLV